MNTKLLRRVIKHIKAEPRRLAMSYLLTTDLDPKANKDKPPCGTAGCIAGWACVIAGESENTTKIHGWTKGTILLGLTNEQAARLFDPPDTSEDAESFDRPKWPTKFSLRYIRAKTPRGRVNATVDRIEHFIKTKGRE